MFKPPFFNSTHKGPKPWPTTTRTPTAVQYELMSKTKLGDITLAIAGDLARQRLAECNGRIKQMYMACRANADNGIVKVTNNTRKIAVGVEGRYMQNETQERFKVTVNADTLLEEKGLKPVNGQILPDYAVIKMSWQPIIQNVYLDGFAAFYPTFRFRVPEITVAAGHWFETSLGGYGYRSLPLIVTAPWRPVDVGLERYDDPMVITQYARSGYAGPGSAALDDYWVTTDTMQTLFVNLKAMREIYGIGQPPVLDLYGYWDTTHRRTFSSQVIDVEVTLHALGELTQTINDAIEIVDDPVLDPWTRLLVEKEGFQLAAMNFKKEVRVGHVVPQLDGSPYGALTNCCEHMADITFRLDSPLATAELDFTGTPWTTDFAGYQNTFVLQPVGKLIYMPDEFGYCFNS